ncbi:MAG TPA: hypothetical protein VD763_04795, partial [Candidatus Saccharimonadales bacterium]|nr:hypothetical protein [Candidatus Saccharimonadales bacterium]
PSQGRVRMLTITDVSGLPITVGVEDQDDLLADARVATPSELAGSYPETGTNLLSVVAIDQRQLAIRWTGSVCDVSLTLSVGAAPDGGAQVDLYGQREACDAMAIERGIVLTFRNDRDAASLIARDRQVVWTFPSLAIGLPVVDVSAAQSIQRNEADDRELAVATWLSLGPGMSCRAPSEPPVSPLQPGCGSAGNWLLERPETLVFRDGPTVKTLQPAGPGLHPHFGMGQFDWPETGLTELVMPIPIVALGHFDDPGAEACPAQDARWCRDLFVIDRIAWAYGNDIPAMAESRDPKVESTPAQVEAIIGEAVATGVVLSGGSAPGRGLGESELPVTDWPDPILETSRVWVVKVLEAGRATLFVVLDDSHRVYRLDDDGEVRLLP